MLIAGETGTIAGDHLQEPVHYQMSTLAKIETACTVAITAEVLFVNLLN